MSTTLSRAVYLQLLGPCSEVCARFAGPLYDQLGSGTYDECSVLQLRGSLVDWQAAHRTARKRAWRAERFGYRFSEIARHEYVDDIFAINTSAPVRQGRPMSAGYLIPPSPIPDPDYPCSLHGVHPYGVLLNDELVAYLWCYRSGDLALVSSILGHAEHLRYDVMYLLMRGTIEAELALGGFLVYNRHDSGTEGLRYFKERCGFEPTEVAWAL